MGAILLVQMQTLFNVRQIARVDLGPFPDHFLHFSFQQTNIRRHPLAY